MAQLSGFFNSQIDENGDYDREYAAEFFAAYFASFIGNGVFPNPSSGLQAIASSGMNVILQPGQAWINGYWYSNTDNLMLTFSAASGTLKRIDAIVMRWSSSGRTIEAVIKEGTPALSPVKPLPQRDADAYELIVAYVHIERNIITITQSNIEDTRPISTICGYVHGVVEQIDTTTLGIQLQTFIDEYMALYGNRYQDFLAFIANLENLCNEAYQGFLDFIANLKSISQTSHDDFISHVANLRSSSDILYNDFLAWLNTYRVTAQGEVQAIIDSIRDILDTEVAGNLLNLIQELQARIPTVVLGTIVHTLGKYATCTLYKTTWAAGVGGAGAGPAGGTNLIRIDGGFELKELDTIIVSAPAEFADCTEITKVDEHKFAFGNPNSGTELTSLLLVLV